MAKREAKKALATKFTKFDPRKITKAARYVRTCWERSIAAAQNMQNAREYMQAAEAAQNTRSAEYKQAEAVLLNLVRGEIMSSHDERGPSRVPHTFVAQSARTVRPSEWNSGRS